MEYTRYTKSVSMFYMALDSAIAKLIDQEMKQRNLGVRQAAAVIGTSHPTLGRALAGEKISFEFAVQLAPFLHIPPENVMRLAGLMPNIDDNKAEVKQLLYLFEQLDQKDRQTILDMMNFLLSK